MIPVQNPIPLPDDFEALCRTPGNQWLAAHSDANPASFPAHWTLFGDSLEKGFGCRCGWWAMRIDSGTVDHFFSKSNPDYRHLVYEWTNYRHAAGSVNSSKGNHDDKLLDPFEVQAGWFEVLLPSMQLVATGLIPSHLRAKARFTLKQLHLENGSKVRRNRLRWYEDYKLGKITLAGLEDYAPLVADAVKRMFANNEPLP